MIRLRQNCIKEKGYAFPFPNIGPAVIFPLKRFKLRSAETEMSVTRNVCRFKITFVYLTLVIQNGNVVYEDREAFHLTMLSIANINVYLRLWINAV